MDLLAKPEGCSDHEHKPRQGEGQALGDYTDRPVF
jgi:hypothetical protein